MTTLLLALLVSPSLAIRDEVNPDTFFAACRAQDEAIENDRAATEADIYIDPSITGSERTLLHDEMLGLPVSLVQNFTFTDANGIRHANRPELIDPPLTWTPTTDNGFINATADPPETVGGPGGSAVFAGASDDLLSDHRPYEEELLTPPDENYGSGNGPFRRVYEQARPQGLTWCSIDGTTPGDGSGWPNYHPYATAPGDIAYTYVSGWTETPNPSSWFDLGLMFSHAYRRFSFFRLRAGAMETWPRPPAQATQFPNPGCLIHIYCLATRAGRVYQEMQATSSLGYWWFRDNLATNAQIFPHSPYLGWSRSCTIGQRRPEGMHSSYFLNFIYNGSNTDSGHFGTSTSIHPSSLSQVWFRMPVITVLPTERVSIDTR